MLIGSPEWKKLLENGAGRIGVNMTSRQIDQLTFHARQLSHWQKKINLTSIRDPKQMAVKHYLDALAPVKIIPPECSLLDIGSGAGFPGIPLKIYYPELRVTLIDSVRKKVSFLKHVIRELSLNNANAIEGRAEDLPPHTRFDVIASRALSGLDTLVKLGWPMLADKGLMIFYKSKALTHELQDAQATILDDGSLRQPAKDFLSFHIEDYTLPYLNIKRSLVIVRRSY
jgi:16S rRNA (guanine527-N7)-methyltransferase